MLNYKNNLRTTLYYKLWSTDTTVSLVHLVTDADEAVRRAAWPAIPFTLTVVNPTNDNIEIIKCTADSVNSSDYISFVCTRGEEDTTASDFEAGYRVENRLTAKHLTDTSSTLDAVKSVTDTVSVDALSNGIPRADASGKLGFDWFPSLVYNVKEVITTSGTYTAPVTGWYKIQTVGGGGGGGKGAYADGSATNGGLGGQQGGTTSFGDISAAGGSGGAGAGAGTAQGTGPGGGGGAPGKVRSALVKVTKGQIINVVIGAGGLGATNITGVAYMGGDGYGPDGGIGGNMCPGQGAVGAQSGNLGPGEPGPGGAGGSNGTGYGGGAGGGAGQEGSRNSGVTPGGRGVDGGTDGGSTTPTTPSATTAGNGGTGGPGAVIIYYFNPAITS